MPSQSAGKVTLAASRGTGNKNIFTPPDKGAVSKAEQLILAQVSGGVAVHLFQYGRVTDLALQQVPLGALFFSKTLFCINQLAEQRALRSLGDVGDYVYLIFENRQQF